MSGSITLTMSDLPHTLNHLANGASARVVSLNVANDLRLRLAALGLRQGQSVCVLRRASMGGPLHIQVGTTEIMLRRQDAARIGITLSHT